MKTGLIFFGATGMSPKVLLICFLSAFCFGCDAHKASQEETFQHLAKAMEINNEANLYLGRFQDYESIDESGFAQLRSYWNDALKEARQVDIAVLNATPPPIGEAFRDNFLKGLELCISSTTKTEYVRCQSLIERFGEVVQLAKAAESAGSAEAGMAAPDLLDLYAACTGFWDWSISHYGSKSDSHGAEMARRLREKTKAKAAGLWTASSASFDAYIDQAVRAESSLLDDTKQAPHLEVLDKEMGRCVAAVSDKG